MTAVSRRLALALAAGLVPSAAAWSQPVPLSPAVIARACADRSGARIDQVRLGEALLIEAGLSPSEFVADRLSSPDPGRSPLQAYSEALVGRLAEIRRARPQFGPEGRLNRAIGILETALARSEPGAPLHFGGSAPAGGSWLFEPVTAALPLICKPGVPPVTLSPADMVGQVEKGQPRDRLAIRQKPEELALVEDERRAAGAFALGLKRTRTPQEDGTTKRVNDVTVDGTVGLRVTRDEAADPSYLYARYQLERTRTRPAPELEPGAREDDDTNALELGALVTADLSGNDFLYLDLQGATVFDFAKNASRLKLRALFEPIADISLGLCGLGSYAYPLGGKLRTRCRAQVDVEAAQVLKRGRIPQSGFDSFLAAGGKAQIEAFLPTGGSVDLLGRIEYRFLPLLSGGPDDIERLEASLKYRFWTASKFGVDLGFSYSKGTNELSFEEEDILSFGLGVIY